jgi:hypothetical protein
MEKPYTPPSILRLTGITMKDYVPVEDFADSSLLDPSTDGPDYGPGEPAPESIHPPDKIPRTFTGLEDWPLHTNLRCWVCDFTFDDRPKFVSPYVREAENGGIEFGVLGNMCTFNCAELWIEEHLGARASNEERWRAQENLCLVYFLFTGRRTAHIKPAPKKTEMRKYGGDWDEDTFWRHLRELDPVAGLRDHTPGSVIPERDRVRAALAVLRSRADNSLPTPRVIADERDARKELPPGEPIAVGPDSVWGVCGLPAAEADSIAVVDPPAAPGGAGPGAELDDLDALLAERGDMDAADDVDAADDASAAPADASAAPAPAPLADSDVDDLLADLGIF